MYNPLPRKHSSLMSISEADESCHWLPKLCYALGLWLLLRKSASVNYPQLRPNYHLGRALCLKYLDLRGPRSFPTLCNKSINRIE